MKGHILSIITLLLRSISPILWNYYSVLIILDVFIYFFCQVDSIVDDNQLGKYVWHEIIISKMRQYISILFIFAIFFVNKHDIDILFYILSFSYFIWIFSSYFLIWASIFDYRCLSVQYIAIKYIERLKNLDY